MKTFGDDFWWWAICSKDGSKGFILNLRRLKCFIKGHDVPCGTFNLCQVCNNDKLMSLWWENEK